MKKKTITKIAFAAPVLLFAIAIGVLLSIRSNKAADAARAENELNTAINQRLQLENQLRVLRDRVREQRTSIMFSEDFDHERFERDNDIFGALAYQIFDWDSYTSYMENRAEFMERFGLTADSNFVSLFMPELPNIQSPDGTNYNEIDIKHMRLSYVTHDSYCINVHPDDLYEYIGEISWIVSSDDLPVASSPHTDFVRYSVDADGNITSIDAWLAEPMY